LVRTVRGAFKGESMRVRRLALLAAPLLLGGALAAGCGSSGTTSSSASSACKIALLLPENTTPRYESADKPYFEAQVAKLAPQCKVLYFNAANDGSLQTQQANTALAEGAKVLVLDSADPQSGAAIVQTAQAKGVKTIAYDRMTGGPVALLTTFNAIQVGNLQGTALVTAMKKAGDPPGSQIVMINGDTSGYEAKLFKKGAQDVIAASGFKIGANYDTVNWDPNTAATEMTQAITKLGKADIKGVYVANDTMAGAAVNAMQQAGIKPLPPVTGQDAATDGLQRILLGTQTMTVYKRLKLLADDAGAAAVAIATGKKMPAASKSEINQTGNKVPAVLLTPISVTTQNMKSTVVADQFVTPAVLCTGDVKNACTKYGI
jgi:D-xylose transport system substrate-binding protein